MLRAFSKIGESAGLLAHEIKNPITGVHVALRAVATALSEDHREIIEDLVARMRRIEAMMRHVLSFAKPLDLHLQVCDARTLFDAATAHLGRELKDSGSTVATQVQIGAVRFTADPALLQDVVCELIKNALESGHGSCLVEFCAEQAEDGSVLMAIQDDGPGIADSIRTSIFKPFITTKPKACGVGLAFCLKIVEEHGGMLDLAIGQPVGARFEIWLPAIRINT